MLPPIRPPQDPGRKKLLEAFDRLPPSGQEQLAAFAEFLLQRNEASALDSANEVPAPEAIPRPEQETVVAAIRRLSASYHMLDKQTLLHETSDLMSAHILQGRPAEEVIDELESLFEAHYRDRSDRPGI